MLIGNTSCTSANPGPTLNLIDSKSSNCRAEHLGRTFSLTQYRRLVANAAKASSLETLAAKIIPDKPGVGTESTTNKQCISQKFGRIVLRLLFEKIPCQLLETLYTSLEAAAQSTRALSHSPLQLQTIAFSLRGQAFTSGDLPTTPVQLSARLFAPLLYRTHSVK